MNRLIKLVKTLSVTGIKSFMVLMNEWVQNKTLDNSCIMLLWSWFTESTKTVHPKDRLVAALLISWISRYKLYASIVKRNYDSLYSSKLKYELVCFYIFTF